MTISNPAQWGVDQIRSAAHALETTGYALSHRERAHDDVSIRIRHLTFANLRMALRRGWDDMSENRTDVLFIALIYPLAGLVLSAAFLHGGFLPLIFPLVSGFALISPFAAAGLYEMSRKRERGEEAHLSDAWNVTKSPAFGGIVLLGAILIGLFAMWMVTAAVLYAAIFGYTAPSSVMAFATDIATTSRGWLLMVAGIGIGAVFACVVLAISVVSFPLMLDRNVSVRTAIAASYHTVAANPVTMLGWGLIVAGSLALAALPALLGLIIVLPLLGHATWHLYRIAIVKD